MSASEMLQRIEIGLGEIDTIKDFDKFFESFTKDMNKYIYTIKESEKRIKKVLVPDVSETFPKIASNVTMEGGEVEDKNER